jgi:uncharacterized FlgJ-related protein
MARILKRLLLTIIGTFLLTITTGSIDVDANQQLLQQHYEVVTSELIFAVSDYIMMYNNDSELSAKLIVSLSDLYDINLKFILAQAHLESHFGTQGLAKHTNSIFNVGAYDDGQILHRYNHPNESIEPYLQLLRNNYLIDKSEEDLLEQFTDRNGSRYASSQQYEKDLSRIIRNIERKTLIDSLDIIRKNIKL